MTGDDVDVCTGCGAAVCGRCDPGEIQPCAGDPNTRECRDCHHGCGQCQDARVLERQSELGIPSRKRH